MKANKYIEMTDTELDQQLAELKTELFNLRFQLATGQLQNPMMIRETKRNIARVKTILRDRQIKAQASRYGKEKPQCLKSEETVRPA